MTTTDRYVAQFEAVAGNGAAAAPAWLKSLRSNAITQFAALGFPTTKQEQWRFTSVRDIAEKAFRPAETVPQVDLTALEPYLIGDMARLVFVNGRFAAPLSSVNDIPDGVVFSSLTDALANHNDIVEAHLGKHVPADYNAFAALNTAFALDGAFVYVPKDVTVENGLHVIYVTSFEEDGALTTPRNLIVVESGARADVIESYVGLSDRNSLTAAVSEVVVGDNAQVECYRIQRESENAYHVANTWSTQGRDSNYAFHTVPLGSRLTRHDIRMVMNGEGGQGILNGLYVTHGQQHVDHNTILEHATPHCESHEYFNGILDDHSRSVFNGRIIVRPGAQKTDSKQTNNNLLLSENARADSQPQLEIYADDVKCTHGATLGPMDQNSLFYLQSRGLNADDARNMLTYGFGIEILDRMKVPVVRDYLDGLIRSRLAQYRPKQAAS
jgi:Fe-S cluster assembly protein SufD